jgi:hypothetical protein
MVPVPIEKRISTAEIVAEGEVVAQRSFWDANKENIYTSYTIQLFKLFKGEVREKQLEVIVQGGTVGLDRHEVSSVLRLHRGQQGIFFLLKGSPVGRAAGAKAPVTRPYASSQGFIGYDLEKGSAKDPFNTYNTVQEVYKAVTTKTGQTYTDVVENTRLDSGILKQSIQKQSTAATMAPVITTLSPTTISAGTGAVLTINGTNFGSSRGNGFVEFPDADEGGTTMVRPYPTDYVSWTNSQIRVRVPSATPTGGTAGTGRVKVTANDGTSTTSTTALTVEFSLLNVVAEKGKTPIQPVLINANRNGGYTIQFAPSMQNSVAAQRGFRRALNTWVCTTNINWEIGTPTTSETTGDDGRNVIRFAPESVTGDMTLARTISRYRGCAISGDTTFWLTEFDMEINNTIAWQFGPGQPGSNQYDFETIVLHELGHAHQLGHVIQPNVLMHYNIGRGRQIRDLTPPDIAGATLVINKSLSPARCGGRSPLTRKLDGDCSLAPEVSAFDAAFAGDVVNVTWTITAGRSIDYYVVQRSLDDSNWEDIGQVANAGARNYTFTDRDPLPRRSFYRLKIVFADRTEGFSESVIVLNPADLRTFKVYPNPIGLTSNADGSQREVLQIEYLVRSSSTLSLKLYDMQGRTIFEDDFTITDGTNVVEINVSTLPAGTYFLRWNEGGSSGVSKVVKL